MKRPTYGWELAVATRYSKLPDSALCRTWKPRAQQANLSLAVILDLDPLRECTR